MSKGLIVSGGHVNRDLLFKLLKQKPDLIVGVDGGMRALWVIGEKPDYILGDFDSCDAMVLKHFRHEGVPEITFSSEKDMTDTELAIRSMIDRGITEATIIGATGTRMDHTLANMMLLHSYADAIDLVVVNETNKIQIAGTGMPIAKDGYKYLSLIPMSDQVTDVTLTGVKYPLIQAILKRESSYAISNEIIDECCKLSFSDGLMLVVQSSD